MESYADEHMLNKETSEEEVSWIENAYHDENIDQKQKALAPSLDQIACALLKLVSLYKDTRTIFKLFEYPTRAEVSLSQHVEPTKLSPISVVDQACEKYSFRSVRGLLNNGNTCYINVILQSLLSCEPFRKAVMAMKPKGGTLIQKFSRLAWAMSDYCTTQQVYGTFKTGNPFIPNWFFGIFPSAPSTGRESTSSVGAQQDAEEFLSVLLNKMKDEEKSGIHQGSSRTDSSSFSSESDSSGSKDHTPLEGTVSRIFRGYLLNEVRRTSENPSITNEGFFSLGLNISSESVASVEDAIQNIFETDAFYDDVSQKTIEKQQFLMKTPEVFILHLQRFCFDYQTCSSVKVNKEVTFPETLHIPDNIRRHKKDADRGPTIFELSAVITHLGNSPSYGHYVCDVRFRKPDGNSVWLLCDDSVVHEVQLEQVLRRRAYILFYTAT